MSVAVYNSGKVAAHSIFANRIDDDVFSEIFTGCFARVTVKNAYFRQTPATPGHLGRPYMEFSGVVDSIFIDPDDQRVFPCGSKELLYMEGQTESVRVRYILSDEEIALLSAKGLFHDDFDVPVNLIGNVIEIPLAVRYKGIYDSPVASIEILCRDSLRTCTAENYYNGIFNACELSEYIKTPQAAEDFVINECNKDRPFLKELADQLEAEGYIVPETEPETEVETELETEAEPEAETAPGIVPMVEKEMQNADNSLTERITDTVSKSARHDSEVRKAQARRPEYADAMQDMVDKRRREQENATQENIYDIGSSAAINDRDIKLSYNDIRNIVTDIVTEKAKAADAKFKNEDSDNTEQPTVMPDQALTFDNSFDNDLSDLSGDTKSERDREKAATQAQNTDRALDIMALNEANRLGVEADLSGMGASISKPEEKPDSKKPVNPADLVSSLLDIPSTPAPVEDHEFL